ncbi:DUF1801 domain-containing protein [Sphingobacterium sp. lm-10]|uniref:iron chaperone n=1 Tax=Sphingobacterium sp. lm-10 TaxID=2944904 RepID=UPI0020214007|nr:DUF1801 domain-containing protein [Sphingobacterium sp. lm-10]MCL7988150.1 DUF1801 domain-containing protein [Sphingobacterium sp. lm-10]
MNTPVWANVDEYIASFPTEVQNRLSEIRRLIHTIAPDADESISYGMPAYKLHGKPLIYFAAFKNHIGFYATPSGHEAFAKDLAVYKRGKGSVQFPLKDNLPLALIERIIRFRKKEQDINLKKT